MHAPEILKKTQQTNLARYGHVNGDVEKMCKTKIAKYGNIFCSKAKYEAICTERYGVPYFCMHTKCKSAQGRVCSKLNETWRNKIFELTGYLFEYERNDIGHWSYDLQWRHYNNCSKWNNCCASKIANSDGRIKRPK